jgi:F-type H+-transporting ATPase subunit c
MTVVVAAVSESWFHVAVVVTAGIAIGLGVIMPALGQSIAARSAIQAIARQPDEAPVISRNLFVALAMTESLALYVLIVALVLLFANPLQDDISRAAAAGKAQFWFLTASSVVAGLSIMLGTTLAAIGQGRVAAAAMQAVAEQPGARDSISTTLYISLALLESLALYSLIVALILLFANPLTTKVLP